MLLQEVTQATAFSCLKINDYSYQDTLSRKFGSQAENSDSLAAHADSLPLIPAIFVNSSTTLAAGTFDAAMVG
jgi:hypothetical protein